MRSKYLRLLLAILAVFTVDFALDRVLKYGLDKGMGLNNHSKILIVGHSHLMMGLDKDVMERELKCKVTKHTRSGVGMAERHLMTRMFMESPYSDSLQIVVIGVDPFSFNGSGLSQNCYTLFYPWMDNSDVANYIKESTGMPIYYAHKLFRTSRYSDDIIKQSIRGWMNDDRNYKTSTYSDSLFNKNKKKWNRPILFQQELQSELELTIKEVTNKGIRVVLLQTPTMKILTNQDKKNYKKIVSYYKKLDAESSLVYYINYDTDFCQCNNLFFDPIHMNIEGQRAFTQRFVDSLRFLLH